MICFNFSVNSNCKLSLIRLVGRFVRSFALQTIICELSKLQLRLFRMTQTFFFVRIPFIFIKNFNLFYFLVDIFSSSTRNKNNLQKENSENKVISWSADKYSIISTFCFFSSSCCCCLSYFLFGFFYFSISKFVAAKAKFFSLRRFDNFHCV